MDDKIGVFPMYLKKAVCFNSTQVYYHNPSSRIDF